MKYLESYGRFEPTAYDTLNKTTIQSFSQQTPNSSAGTYDKSSDFDPDKAVEDKVIKRAMSDLKKPIRKRRRKRKHKKIII